MRVQADGGEFGRRFIGLEDVLKNEGSVFCLASSSVVVLKGLFDAQNRFPAIF
jgi:hypothetical protein